MSKLLQIIALLYKMNAQDRQDLEAQLLAQRKRVWRQALADEARNYRCNKTPRDPSAGDLADIKFMSAEDARSIVNTYNRDVERQLVKLYNANPRGNRYYYAKQMEEWAAARALWKIPSISLNTETITREFALVRFREMNLPNDLVYIFTGPPPTCEVCVAEFAAGLVSYTYIRQHPCPRHVNCPHSWKPVRRPRIDCEDLWLG